MESSRIYGQRKLDLLPPMMRTATGRLEIKRSDLEGILLQSRNLSLLMDVVRNIMTRTDLQTLLGQIMGDVTTVMEADRSTLFLLDREKNEIWSSIAQGEEVIRLPRGTGISGHVIDSGQIVNIADAYNDPRFFPDYDRKTGYRTRTILCVPIYNPQAELIGAIQVLNKKTAPVFSEADEKLLSAFSSLAGIAIANAFSFETMERLVAARTAELREERDKSDRLLLNILPLHVAQELKASGTVKPVFFDYATILFTDFKGFTKVAQRMAPEQLIGELDSVFLQFDTICERNGIEKLKTIGDAYMCAGGLPVSSKTHAIDVCLAALEIREFMAETRRIKQEITGEKFWEVRIGVHSGPVIAGVIGKNKFAYDVWGDAVNVASRLESSGQPGEINISSDTYKLVKDFFECEPRGSIAIKNRGEVEMYFLRCIRPELSRDPEGKIPAEAFYQKKASLA
ncbi:MAG: GAF domain-containing protein [Spirochaetales bacterium]|nr:GAF domain-containing protein [Spirochaetales bacterium]